MFRKLYLVAIAWIVASAAVLAWVGPIPLEGAIGGTGNDTTAWTLGGDDAGADTSVTVKWPGATKDDLFVGFNVCNASSTSVVSLILEQRLCSVDSVYAWDRVDSTTGITAEAGSAGGVWDPTLQAPPAEFRLIAEGDSLNDKGTVVQLWIFRGEH